MDSWIESLIQDLSEEIKKNIKLNAIIIFGSHNEGTATNESDVDLAIVSPSFIGMSSLDRRKAIKNLSVK